eukprot:Gb_11186 [translate_table: standard]
MLEMKNPRVSRKLPPNFLFSPSLLKLELYGYLFLEELPSNLGELGTLRELDLQAFRSLVVVNLEDYHSLEQLSESFGKLPSLKELHMHSYWRKLLRGMCELNALVDLTIKCKEGLSELLELIGELASLEYLCIECGSAPSIIVQILYGGLSSLSSVKLCIPILQTIRESYGNLNSLQRLGLHSQSLETILGSLGNLSSL